VSVGSVEGTAPLVFPILLEIWNELHASRTEHYGHFSSGIVKLELGGHSFV
jgi:hypothetical protein